MASDTREKNEIARALRAHLASVTALRRRTQSDAQSAAVRDALRHWQAQRLARTYPDLLSSPRFGDAARFFQNDLYGPKDFTRRDAEVERIVPTLTRMLPVGALEVIVRATELDALSESLDADMAIQLGSAEITEERYAAAYRATGTRADRERQIVLIGEIGTMLNRLVRLPLLGTILAMMHGPALVAGLGGLHDFLQRGFDAFRKMRDATFFVETIIGRETELLERLYSEDENPFQNVAA